MIREIVLAVVFVALAAVGFYFLFSDVANRQAGVYYDCSMASFHPDIPPAVKEACRNRNR